MPGTAIANEVATALAEAGSETGAGAPYVCTLRRAASGPSEPQNPWDAEGEGAGTPTDYDLTCVKAKRRIRDQSGMLTGQVETVLLVDATVVAPLKSDTIALGVAKADVTADTAFVDIADIEATEPGGVAVMYKVTLAD